MYSSMLRSQASMLVIKALIVKRVKMHDCPEVKVLGGL